MTYAVISAANISLLVIQSSIDVKMGTSIEENEPKYPIVVTLFYPVQMK